jgi:Mg/Co/Ni transporter MgtE
MSQYRVVDDADADAYLMVEPAPSVVLARTASDGVPLLHALPSSSTSLSPSSVGAPPPLPLPLTVTVATPMLVALMTDGRLADAATWLVHAAGPARTHAPGAATSGAGTAVGGAPLAHVVVPIVLPETDVLTTPAAEPGWEAQMASLSSLQRIDLVKALGPARLPPAVFAQMRPSELAVVLAGWPARAVAPLLDSLGAAERAELLQQLPLAAIDALAPVLTSQDLELVKYAHAFRAGSVGRIMRPLSMVLHLPATTPVADAVAAVLARTRPSGSAALSVLVMGTGGDVDHDHRRLHGIVPLVRLLTHPDAHAATATTSDEKDMPDEDEEEEEDEREEEENGTMEEADADTSTTMLAVPVLKPVAVLGDLAEPPALTMHVDMPQDQMRATVRGLGGSSGGGGGGSDLYPVVDDDGLVYGVVTLRECWDASEAAVVRAYGGGAGGGVGGSESANFVKTSARQLLFRRSLWLSALILVNMGCSFVIGSFDAVLVENVALASFIPMLIGMGGNTGGQAVALVISALAARSMTVSDWRRALRKELPIALALGALIAAFSWIIAYARTQDSDVAASVGISMLLIMVSADLLGLVLPFMAVKLRVDPELMSNPLLTTVVDLCGLAIYFAVAMAITGML